MSRRVVTLNLPAAPASWDKASKEAWNSLIAIVAELSYYYERPLIGRNYVVSGMVPTTVTLDVANPEVTAAVATLAKLLKDQQVAGIIEAEISG